MKPLHYTISERIDLVSALFGLLAGAPVMAYCVWAAAGILRGSGATGAMMAMIVLFGGGVYGALFVGGFVFCRVSDVLAWAYRYFYAHAEDADDINLAGLEAWHDARPLP